MRRATTLALLSLLGFAPHRAAAMGAIVGSSSHAASMSGARIAVAVSPRRTTRWAQVQATTDGGGFTWLVPVSPGARVDLGADAWLDALDAATSPVVLAPPSAPPCAVSLAPEAFAPMTSGVTSSPTDVVLALDASTLATFVAQSELTIDSTLATGLGEVFASGGAVLALTYGSGATTAHSLRIVDDGPPTVPVGLSGSASGPLDVTTFLIAGEPQQVGSAPLHVDPNAIEWLSDGTSNYAATARAVLDENPGAWLMGGSSQSAFFAPTAFAPKLSLPDAVAGYYALAAEYGETRADPGLCAAAAGAANGAVERYAAACPRGAVAVVPGESPCAREPDRTPIEPLLCGDAVDAALSVADLPPESIWIARASTSLTAATAADAPIAATGATPDPIVLEAGGYGGDCPIIPPPPEADAGAGVAGGGGGYVEDPSNAECESTATTDADPGDPSEGCGSSSDPGDSGSDDSGGGCSSDDTGDDGGGCSSGDSGVDDCSLGADGHRGHRRHSRSPLSRAVLGLALALAVGRRLRRAPHASDATK